MKNITIDEEQVVRLKNGTNDGEGVTEDEAAPHDEVPQLRSEHSLRLAAEKYQRNLAEHSEKCPGLQ